MCRILAIAPYESMRNLIVNLCADRPEIQLTALVGDLEEGAKLVQTIPSEDYDTLPTMQTPFCAAKLSNTLLSTSPSSLSERVVRRKTKSPTLYTATVPIRNGRFMW